MGGEKVPVLNDYTNYTDYKNRVRWWLTHTKVDKKQRAGKLIAFMDGKAEASAITLDPTEMAVDDGVDKLLVHLDTLYKEDATQTIFQAISHFLSYTRPSTMNMNEFIREFTRRHQDLTQKRGSQTALFEDGILAYFLLQQAGLSEEQKTLIRATTINLSFKDMSSSLKKAFGEDPTRPSSRSSSSGASSSSSGSLFQPIKSEPKVEPTFFGQHDYEGHFREEYDGSGYDEGDQSLSTSSRDADFNEVFYQQNFGNHRFQQPGFRPYGSTRPRGGMRPNFRRPAPHQFQTPRVPGRHPNPYAMRHMRNRGPLICHSCGKSGHMARECSYNTYNGDRGKKPGSSVFFKSDINLSDEDESLVYLMGESVNHALLDTGSSSTVCGKKWLNLFKDSLSTSESDAITNNPTKRVFRFGDGDCVTSEYQVRLPITICGKDILLDTFVVENDIPLLFSRDVMKKMKMKIDNEHDKIYALGGEEDLTITQSGHMVVPIGRSEKALTRPGPKMISELTFHASSEKTPQAKAEHLHRYFAHGSTAKIKQFVHSIGLDQGDEITKELDEVAKKCDFCLKHKSREVPHRSVALPSGYKFNDVLAMDLKMLNGGQWIVHFIDSVTRYASAAPIPDKSAEVIVTKIFEKWISVFGRSHVIMSDNGGEFVNSEFIEMCSRLGIVFQTSPAESPWCNGTVERHNGLLAQMIEGVKADTNCNIEIAVSWAVNAKNSLCNVYGFSPHQLVFGSNPEIPGILSEYASLTVFNEDTASTIVAEHMRALQAARTNFIQLENSDRLKRILRDRVYSKGNKKYSSGDTVYYKRQNHKGSWFGPARVVGQVDNSVLIKHGGALIRIHPCKVVLKEEANQQITSHDKEPVPDIQSVSQPERAMQRQRNQIYSQDSDESDEECRPTQLPNIPAESRATVQDIRWKSVDANTKLKKDDNIRFREDESQDWTSAAIHSRAGKTTGVNKHQYNIQIKDNVTVLDVTTCNVELEVLPETEQRVLFIDDEVFTASIVPQDLLQKAKEEELTKFKSYDVYEEVKDVGQYAVSCRWVVTESKGKVKARLVARGFEEELLTRVDAPTVSPTSMWIFLSICCSNKWKLQSFDITSAFLQSESLDREVFVNPPAEFRKPGVVWALKKPLYGLADSPRRWYLTLKTKLLELNCELSVLDKTVFRFYDNGKLLGILVTHVDDCIYAGSTKFCKLVVDAVLETFKISRHNTCSFTYLGLDMVQDPVTQVITVDQSAYAATISPYVIPASRKKSLESPLTKEEMLIYQSKLGKLLWLSGRTRPDMRFDVMELSTKTKNATITDLIAENRVIRRISERKSVLQFKPLDLKKESIKVIFYSDASLGNLPNSGSARGSLVFLGSSSSGTVNLISWCSNRLKRVTHSTFGAETLACTASLSDAIYCRQLISELLYSDPRSQVIPVLGFVDNKQLSDQLASTKQCQDRRVRLDISEIQESLSLGVTIQWTCTKDMLADCLTKRGCDPAALCIVLESNICDVIRD